MLLMISSQGDSLHSQPSLRFGRAPYFIQYDLNSDEWAAYQNKAVMESGGAGVVAAQFLSDHQTDVALSGRFGPNAHQALSAAGIQMQTFDGQYETVQDVINGYKSGNLTGVS